MNPAELSRSLDRAIANLPSVYLRSRMSALGHKLTYAVRKGMSALPLKADMCGATSDVCFGPIADIVSQKKDRLAAVVGVGRPGPSFPSERLEEFD